ncbi:hypothetical protein [Turneriella parva]|uniref:Uncharacterized protein n=1 Tax=Turneriella parva (strain ATCC BAA-1111 / DSM 21527 / NCTC 11395 / H) TaxID=869212 RepID=I4B9P5_TURPD|nr:hypothetical protein [Turneriella parva]AFM14002.1 hypothetical protein Turpa_3364 [Turneriella parva DSM 21527]
MDLKEYIGHALSIAGILISIATAIWATMQMRRSVGITFSLDIRRNIERLERNKQKFRETVPEAYKEFFDVQSELETVDKKLQEIFKLRKDPH